MLDDVAIIIPGCKYVLNKFTVSTALKSHFIGMIVNTHENLWCWALSSY